MSDTASGAEQTRPKILNHFHHAISEETHLAFQHLFQAMTVIGLNIEGQPGDKGSDNDQQANACLFYVLADYGQRLLADAVGNHPGKGMLQ